MLKSWIFFLSKQWTCSNVLDNTVENWIKNSVHIWPLKTPLLFPYQICSFLLINFMLVEDLLTSNFTNGPNKTTFHHHFTPNLPISTTFLTSPTIIEKVCKMVQRNVYLLVFFCTVHLFGSWSQKEEDKQKRIFRSIIYLSVLDLLVFTANRMKWTCNCSID